MNFRPFLSVLKPAVLACFLLTGTRALAGLEVVENLGNGTEKDWGRKPAIAVVEDPSSAIVGVKIGAKNPVISQTFTPTRNFTLDKIVIRYCTEGAAGGKYLLKIQEVPEGVEGLSYAEGKSLFAQPLGFSFATDTKKEKRWMEFKFTEGDKISLKRGVTYAFELVWVEGPEMVWLRRAADVYDKGRAFVDRTQLSGGDEARDMAMAIFPGS